MHFRCACEAMCTWGSEDNLSDHQTPSPLLRRQNLSVNYNSHSRRGWQTSEPEMPLSPQLKLTTVIMGIISTYHHVQPVLCEFWGLGLQGKLFTSWDISPALFSFWYKVSPWKAECQRLVHQLWDLIIERRLHDVGHKWINPSMNS